MSTAVDKPETPGRARPLAVEDRRAMIIEAILPLLLEQGRELTTRQIAEAAGVAEGTIFRAFGDKETLIEAAVRSHLDPEPMRRELRAVDSTLSLEEKLPLLLAVLRRRFSDIFRLVTVMGSDQPVLPPQGDVVIGLLSEALAPDLERLALPPERVAQLLRLVAFAAAFPQLSAGVEFGLDELTAIILNGVTVSDTITAKPEPRGL